MLVTISCGTLELAAFDCEITARAKVSGQASGPGSILVTGSDLAATVKSLPKGKTVTAELTISDDTLVITCDGTESVVAGMGEEATKEYPQLPAMPSLSGYADAEAFARSVARVARCAGTDGTLPVLMCVKVTSGNGSLEMAATDRYRLGVDRLHWTGPDGIDATIPAVTLAKFAAKADKRGKIALHFAAGHAGFSDGVYSLITSTSKGEFPKFRQHIRTDHGTVATADAAKLEAAVARAGKIGERNSRTGFTVTNAGITVTAHVDGKVAASQVAPATVDGSEFDTGFNAGYLASVLAGFTGPVRVGLKMNTRTRTDYAGKTRTETVEAPAVLTADGDTFTAVIMPIRKAQ